MIYVLNRLKEPSSFAGLAGVLASIGLLGLSETEWTQLFGVIAACAGAAAVFMGEGKQDPM